ncbi:MAG: rRNA maturation RNase YbeY [Terriglobia bacterium]
MIYNRQKQIRLNLKGLEDFASELARELKLGRRWFDITFVDDREIQRLNREFRHKKKPTDALSFPWAGDAESSRVRKVGEDCLAGFLGDVIISAPMARRDAAEEGMTPDRKLRQLVLHGALHLVGYDHETDSGEMHALEYELRCQFAIDTAERSRVARRARPKNH